MSRIIPIFVPHLGCPQDCVFCNQRSIAAPHEPSPDEVAREIESALERSGDGAELAYYGGSFTAIEREKRLGYLEAAQPFLRDGRLCSIRVSTRPDCISCEIMDELRRYGVKTVELGAQSTDDRVLAMSNRGHTKEDIERASRLLKEGGFTLGLQMMIGLPGESGDGHIRTARDLIAMQPDFVRVYPTVVVRGTALERMWRDGEYTALTPERAAILGADVLDLFDAAGIPVIRFGLNPTEDLKGDAVAGAYHPALGEMARGEQMRRRAAALLEPLRGSERATLVVAKGRTSTMVGQHRRNIDALRDEFDIKRISVRESAEIEGYNVKTEEI